jgi:erythrocyte band 7 integral membrane protein
MEQTLDEATDPWGVKVERVEMWVNIQIFIIPRFPSNELAELASMWTPTCSKDVRLPVQLHRARAAAAVAAREARAKVIAAEGEQKASKALREAAEVISQSPSALQVSMSSLLVLCTVDTWPSF